MKSQKNKKIFIVTHDPYWIAMLTQMLNELGYTNIFEFENGKDCFENLNLNPKIVFLDDQMNDMEGLIVLQKIKAYFRGMGIVFCTAHQDLGVSVNAMGYGSFDHLHKENTSKSQLASIIANLINKAVEADEIY